MKQIRLLPLVVLSIAVLAALKSIGLMTSGGYVLLGSTLATAQDAETPATEKENTAEAPKEGEAPKAEGDGQETAETKKPVSLDEGRDVTPTKVSRSETSIVNRLKNARATIEKREKELELRESLLKAAEKRIEKRIAELKKLETRIGVALKKEEEQRIADVKTLIAMYEKMKPASAARIFDKLDIGILVDVVRHMKPAKMAAILGKMAPEVAQALTIEIARRGQEKTPSAEPLAELPKIGQDTAG
ncbi:MotE family protein [Coralliovum pocilloporae]|uniref:MotE family protein n=1 Tax=Coralliovum pocilloporae TaxID=3066369 RepID=UPI003306EBA7